MIAIFDEDGGGNVDFQEFVSGLSAFSSKGNKEQKLAFAFKVYDIDRDGYISNGELFIVLKMMVGSNLKDQQLQQIVDKTIMEADLDKDGKISFDEFKKMVENTDVSMSMTLGEFLAAGSSEAQFYMDVEMLTVWDYRPLLSQPTCDDKVCTITERNEPLPSRPDMSPMVSGSCRNTHVRAPDNEGPTTPISHPTSREPELVHEVSSKRKSVVVRLLWSYQG